MSDFELVWDSRCGVAESPVWDAPNRRLLFADINGRRINALSVDSGDRTSWDFPEVVGSFGLCRSGRLVVAQRHHIVVFDPVSTELRRLTDAVDEPPTNRLNDGKVGPDGAFWVGSMDENSPRQKIGALYRVTPDGRITKEADGIAVSNGLAWSADGRTMYHSDSTAAIVQAWDFDPVSGGRSRHRILATLANEDGRPDGAATDMDGNYWSCGPSAGVINCFSPEGKLLRKWPFPVPGPTMPCFAGDRLYVTSLREGKSAEVLAAHPTLGGLFRAAAPAVGAPVGLFADQ
ncbi:MAG TPA: SMP-30/gluconolactonase/LRE family protein [Rhodopila sp.]|uniref:SMP-30/gluconolactonase/LRE family protein n=1 Tax=Rhodopila sp. TaxID=2480087 RepID=UPI002C4EBCD1|nr:SMP-30/gluconolactonase/LRE family protein [Rhodopila sp.]HVY14160.1 SMP-30/gluconolactonase/LRE family protein [Rhodopila sp.]